MIKQINFFNWLSKGKNLVLSNGSENVRNVIPGIKKAFFNYKKLRSGSGFCPQTPVSDRFELHYFTLHVFQFSRLHFLTIGLSPLSLAKSWLNAKPGHSF